MKQKRGICAGCGHERWRHFDQNTEMCFQNIGKCRAFDRSDPCICPRYRTPYLLSSLETIEKYERLVGKK